jgi:hypothetical protein
MDGHVTKVYGTLHKSGIVMSGMMTKQNPKYIDGHDEASAKEYIAWELEKVKRNAGLSYHF